MPDFKTTHGRSGQSKHGILDAEISLLGFRGDIAVFKDGSVAAGICCEPITPYLLPPNRIAERLGKMKTRLMTTGSRQPAIGGRLAIQVRYVQDNRIKEVRDSLYASQVENPVLRGFHQEIGRNLEANCDAWNLRLYRTLVFVVWTPSKEMVKELKLRAKTRAKEALKDRTADDSLSERVADRALLLKSLLLLSERELAAAADEVRIAITEVFDDFMRLRANPHFIKRDEFLQEYYRIWNPSRWAAGGKPRVYDPNQLIPPSAYFVQSDFQWDPSGQTVPKGMFFLDGCYHAMLWLRLPPNPMKPFLWERLGVFGVNQLEIISHYRAGDMRLRLDRIEDEVKILEKNSSSAADNSHYQQLVQEAEELGKGEEKIFQSAHFVHVWAENEKRLAENVRVIHDIAEAVNQMVLVQETIALKEAWLGTMPGVVGPFDEYRQVEVNSRQASYLMPAFGSPTFLGNGRRVEAIFQTITGSMLNVILKGPHVTNYNILVSGSPGRGKSFMVNQVLAQLARLNPKVVIVDLGDSYRRLVELAGGVNYEMELGNEGVCVNPFDNVLDADFDDDDVLTTLKLLETLVFDPTRGQLPVPQKENLRQAFQQLCNMARNEGRIPTLTDYHKKLYDLDIKLAELLQRWTRASGSAYSRLLDGDTRLSLDNNWIAFELGRVQKDEIALMVMIQLIFAAVARMASTLTKDTPKLLVFEEGGVTMKIPIFRDWLEAGYRTMRKYGVSVLGVAQNFGDWAPIKANGRRDTSITNQVSHYFSLGMEPEECAQAQEAFELSDHERLLLQTCETKIGVLSHAFYLIIGAEGKQAHRILIQPTPVSYAFSTTDEADKAEIERIRRDERLSLPNAVLRFSELFPRGVKNAALRG